MIRILAITLLIISTLSCNSSSQKVTNPKLINLLNSLYEQKDFFSLNHQFEAQKAQLSEANVLYFSALLNNVFNQQKNSNETISVLLEQHKEKFTDVQLSKIYEVKLMNHLNNYEYAQAAAVNEILIKNYASIFDSTEVANFKNEWNIWTALKNTPKQGIAKNKDSVIPTTRDKAGLTNIDVAFGEKKLNFIFDTGANFSFIKRSLAETLELEIIQSDFYVTAATGAKVKCDLAIAASLQISDIICKNVVFLIMEDEALAFPQIDYFPNGAIGFPVIEAFDEIHFHQKEQLFVPKTPIKYPYHNLALDGLMPVIAGIHQQDTLIFHLDTGAGHTALFPAFFQKYRAEIEAKYPQQNFSSGSVGGQVHFKGYVIPEFPLTIANSSATLDSLQLHIENIGGEDNHFHGNFGQDFIQQFDKMIISFKHCAILFE